MTATIATDARTLVTAAADTSATASRAHWYGGDHSVDITRRRLASGLVRIRITYKRLYIPSAQQAHEVTEYRDLPAAEADALFAKVVMAYDARYIARLPRACRPKGTPKKWLTLAA